VQATKDSSGNENGSVAVETEAAAVVAMVETVAATAMTTVVKLRLLRQNVSCSRCG